MAFLDNYTRNPCNFVFDAVYLRQRSSKAKLGVALMKIRKLKQSIFASTHRWGMLHRLQKLGSRIGAVYVLAYHRVGDPREKSLQGMDLFSATPEQFNRHMQLIEREYHPITAEDMLNAVEQNASLPRHAVLVTVDDGYIDFRDHIFPIANQYGIRPTLFIPTYYVGKGDFWWDKLARALYQSPFTQVPSPLGVLHISTSEQRSVAMYRLSNFVREQPFEFAREEIELFCAEIAPDLPEAPPLILDWDDLRILKRSGVTIASHAHSHPILSHVTPEQIRTEMRTSQMRLEQEIGQVLPILAYPDGRPFALSEDVVDIARQEGFKLAFTRAEGWVQIYRDDPLLLSRLGVERYLSLPQFHFHLTPSYQYWKKRFP